MLMTYGCIETLLALDERIVAKITEGLNLPFVLLEANRAETTAHSKLEVGSLQTYSFHIFAETFAETKTIEEKLYAQFQLITNIKANAQVYNKEWIRNGTIQQEDGVLRTIITVSFTLKNY